MANLKTLKEISLVSCSNYFDGSSWEALGDQVKIEIKKELRKEATKWIKELSKNLNVSKLFEERVKAWSQESILLMSELMWEKAKQADFEIIRNNARYAQEKIDWIKLFFNISDEDLK